MPSADPMAARKATQRKRTGRLKLTVTNRTNRNKAHFYNDNPSGRVWTLPPQQVSTIPEAIPPVPSSPPQQPTTPTSGVLPALPPAGGSALAQGYAATAANISALAQAAQMAQMATLGEGKGKVGSKVPTGSFGGDVPWNSPGTPDPQAFAKQVLTRLGAPVNDNTMALMGAWFTAEGTDAKWNPLGSTMSWGGSSGFNDVGVQNYKSMQDGVAATVRTMTNGRYDTIVKLLKQGINPIALFRKAEPEFDVWRGSTAGHYGLIKILKDAMR